MSNEIKLGDKVRVSKDAPELYTMYGQTDWESVESTVEKIDGDAAEIRWLNEYSDEYDYITIPTKYLVKVDAEAEEARFKYQVGQKVKSAYADEILTIKEHCGRVGHDNVYRVEEYAYTWNECERRPYTEPTDQTEAEKKPNVGSIKIPVEVDLKEVAKKYAEAMSNAIREYGDALCKHGTFIRMVDDLYKRDLAKEIALKVANKFNTPEETAEHAVKVAKAVVEGLKRK